jgi:AcrR family transcriptional regulator
VSPAGRRPGKIDTRPLILDAARDCFAESGYDATTIRAIAGRAGVDPALVHHFFGTKSELFVAAIDFPFSPRPALPLLPLLLEDGDAGARIVAMFLSLWDDEATRRRMLAVVRSATQHELAAVMLRTFLRRGVVGTFVNRLPSADAELRATLVGSQLIGMAIARYVIALPPLSTASNDELVAAYGPTIQRYLTGNIGIV